MTIDCQFSNPQTWDGSAPSSNQDIWAFKNVSCSSSLPEYISLVKTPESNPRQFYLSQIFTFGDGLIVAILLLLTFITLMFKIGSILKRH